MVQRLCLDENEHAVSMLRGMKEMKHEQDLCDFIIKVKSDEYQTHKVALSSGSAYFKAMFKHDTVESRDGKVEMKDVDSECVKSCIDFLYSGKFDIPDGKIGQLLHVAVMFQLDKVKNAISDFMNKSLNADNFYESREIANLYDLKSVSEKCKTYYNENLLAISCQPGFKNEEKSHISGILKSENMKLSEEDKLTVSLRWVGENPEQRKNLLEMVKLVKLKSVPLGFLSDLLDNHSLITNDLHLYKLISAPLVENVKQYGKSNTIDPDSHNLIILFESSADRIQSYDTATCEVVDFHTEKFKHLINFSAVSTNSHVYVLCENKSVHRLDFRDKNSKWERMREMIGSHGKFPPVVSLSSYLFVVGNSCEMKKDVEIFSPAENQWLSLKDKPEAICGHTLVSLNDSIFCVGGWCEYEPVNSFCQFIPTSSEWVKLEPMKKAKGFQGTVAVDQKIFVIGGLGYVSSVSDVECYDVSSAQWTDLSPMINPCHDLIALHADGWIYLVSRCEALDKAQKYNIENNRWCKVDFNNVELFNIEGSVLVKV